MDRPIAYVGQSIYEWNLSKPAQNEMVAISKLAAALFGTNGIVNGLACTQTTVPSMQVSIGAGELYQLSNLESTVCGTLPADTTNQILKQGILLGSSTPYNVPASSTFAAPSTVGQSINYLIEAQYVDQDVSIDPTTGSTPVVLQFYDAANPSLPWSGANNLGASSNTFRKGVIQWAIKAGAAATTGTQTTPSADSGYIGLYVVTVAYGASSITNSNISVYPGAPFIGTGIIPSIQKNTFTFASDTGTVNVYQAAYSPAISAVQDGLTLTFKAKNTNTGASTFSPNGLAASPIYSQAHVALLSGEIVANGFVEVEWNSTLNGWVLCENSGGIAHGTTPAQFDNSQKLATSQFVQRALGNTNGAWNYAASATINAAAIGGVHLPTVAGVTLTLPDGNSCAVGSVITIHGNSWGCTVQRQGTNTIALGSGGAVTSVSVGAFDRLVLVNVGPNWCAIGGETSLGQSTSFSAYKGNTGYQKLPSGLIIQWGSCLPSPSLTVNFPIAFPTACVAVNCTPGGTGLGNAATHGNTGNSLTSFVANVFIASTGAGTTCTVFWIAIGY